MYLLLVKVTVANIKQRLVINVNIFLLNLYIKHIVFRTIKNTIKIYGPRTWCTNNFSFIESHTTNNF